jgi:hypothetical protein
MRHGRLAQVAPAARVDITLSDAAERYAFALVEKHLARKVGDAKARKAATQRSDRARSALVLQPGGLTESRRIVTSLHSCGGAVLRVVEKAHPDLREFAARAAVRLTALVREHDVQSTSALLLLGSASQWSALGEMLRERAFAIGPAILTTSKAMRVDDGGTVSASLPAFESIVRLARDCSATARLDLLSALELEKQARDANDRKPFDLASLIAPTTSLAAAEEDEEDEVEVVHSGPPAARPSDFPVRGLPAAPDAPMDGPGPIVEARAPAAVNRVAAPPPPGQWRRAADGTVVATPRAAAAPRPRLPDGFVGPPAMPTLTPKKGSPR